MEKIKLKSHIFENINILHLTLKAMREREKLNKQISEQILQMLKS